MIFGDVVSIVVMVASTFLFSVFLVKGEQKPIKIALNNQNN